MSENVTRRKRPSNQFIIQGSILAVVGILVRIIGLIRRVPLTNIIGDMGNGFYAAAYEIYSIILLISSYSLPLAVSKIVSARIAVGQYKNAKKILQGSLLFAVISGGLASIFLFIFADIIAGPIMLEPLSALSLKILAPTLLVVAIMGVLRGYFQGIGTMIPTAISQVIEQIFVVVASLLGASILYDYGDLVGGLLKNDQYAAAYGAAGGSMGPLAGAVAGVLFLIFVFSIYRPFIRKKITMDKTVKSETLGEIFPMLLKIIVPVILSTAIYNICNILDQRIYYQVMIGQGYEDLKTIHWGIYTGKYIVLTNIPIAFASSLCAATVPAITMSKSRGEYKEVLNQIRKVTKITMLISIPCFVGLSVMATPILSLLFNDISEMPTTMLQIGSISVVFYSLSTLSNGILQGIDKIHIPVRNAIISVVIHIISLYGMLSIFHMGIYSVVIANIIFSLSMCILNNRIIHKETNFHYEYKKTFIIPMIASFIMGLILSLLKSISYKIIPSGKLYECLTVALLCLLGACIYFVIVISCKVITKREIEAIPGTKILKPFLKLLK